MEHPRPEKAKYKIGDLVTVIDGSKLDHNGIGWCPDMVKLIGKSFKIASASYNSKIWYYMLNNCGNFYNYDENWLEPSWKQGDLPPAPKLYD